MFEIAVIELAKELSCSVTKGVAVIEGMTVAVGDADGCAFGVELDVGVALATGVSLAAVACGVTDGEAFGVDDALGDDVALADGATLGTDVALGVAEAIGVSVATGELTALGVLVAEFELDAGLGVALGTLVEVTELELFDGLVAVATGPSANANGVKLCVAIKPTQRIKITWTSHFAFRAILIKMFSKK